MSSREVLRESALKYQCIVQYMLANGCVKDEEFRDLLNKLMSGLSSQLSDEKIFTIVQEINTRLSRFNMMVRATIDEVTAQKYYVLISMVDNEITRAASHHTPKQFEFFKLVLQEIVHSERTIPRYLYGFITEKCLKQLADKATVPTSKTRSCPPEYLVLYDDWVKKNWLQIVNDGEDCITLGVRSLAELDVFIKQRLMQNKDLQIYKAT